MIEPSTSNLTLLNQEIAPQKASSTQFRKLLKYAASFAALGGAAFAISSFTQQEERAITNLSNPVNPFQMNYGSYSGGKFTNLYGTRENLGFGFDKTSISYCISG